MREAIKTPVTRFSRMIIAIIGIGITTPYFLLPILNERLSPIYVIIRILIIILIIALFIFYATAVMIIKNKNDKLILNWTRRFIFDKKKTEIINISEIKTLVVDKETVLSKIIEQNREIEIHNLRTGNISLRPLILELSNTVKENGGNVITSTEYYKDKGYYDSSFKLAIYSLVLVTFFINKLWDYNEFRYYSLILIILPLALYYRHVKLRIRKKTRGNKAYKSLGNN